MEQKLLDILQRYWHYDSFRPMQHEAIKSVLSGRDTLVLMPTGGGKSIIYQLPTLASDGLCIVVTPLIALMKDQVDTLRQRGIPAVAVHSGLTQHQIDIALDNCVYGDVKFLYIAPERLASEMFRLRVDRMNVSLLAVDEAHCISQWGYDFRPAYLRIKELRQLLPNTPVLALTASATPRVAQDIMEQLIFSEPHILQASFLRPNLSYSVRETDDKEEQLMRIVHNVEGCGIVYVRKRNTAELIAKYLIEQGESASFYHGGLPNAERTMRQDEWIGGKTRIMVATNAFGMGIDKADVRFVVHYTMSDSLEAYYQEAGRAGRDGKRSYAVILKSSSDNQRILNVFEKEFPDISLIQHIYNELCSYLGVAIGDGKEASFVFNMYDFCRRVNQPIITVHNIIKLLQLNGYMTLVEDCEHPARLMFTISRDDLYQVPMHSETEEVILRSILRLYTGVFSEFRPIDEMEIAAFSKHTYEEVHAFLKRMWRANVIRYIPTNHDPLIFLDEERLPARDVYISPETYSHRKALMMERFNHLLHYANEESECRSRIIEKYFCDKMSEPCGICDNCLARKRRAKTTSNESYEKRILDILANEPLTIKELVTRIVGNENIIVESVRQQIDKGIIICEGTKLRLKN